MTGTVMHPKETAVYMAEYLREHGFSQVTMYVLDQSDHGFPDGVGIEVEIDGRPVRNGWRADTNNEIDAEAIARRAALWLSEIVRADDTGSRLPLA